MPVSRAGRLRVHGGEMGGRRLQAPPGVRPTQGLVKEAIFNMLAAELVEASVIDLFSGSGALGIEALSRGAATATFVERAAGSVSILRRNLESLGYGPKARVIQAEVLRWLKTSPEAVAKADFVFLDPPYLDPILEPVLKELDAAVAPAAKVVVEHGRKVRLADLERLKVLRERAYGDTRLVILGAAP